MQKVQGSILIIDDNESLCKTLNIIFSKNGYFTETAYSGAEALKKARESEFDFALLDIRLPDFKGTELLSRLSRENPEMDIIMITGHATVDSAVESLTSNATDYMTKPLDMEEMLATIASMFEKKRLLREKRKAEKALRRSEQKLRSLVNSLHDIVFVFDKQNKYADYFCSDKSLLYHPEATFLGKQIDDVLPSRVATIYSNAIDHVRELGSTRTIEYHLTLEEDTRWFSVTLSPHEDSSSVIASVQEITQRREAMEALETTEELYASTIEAVEDCILVVDLSGCPMYWNSKFVQICTLNTDNMKRMSALDIFKESIPLLNQADEFFETLETINPTTKTDSGTLKFLDGRTFEWHTAPITKEEKLVARVWTFSDITQLKRAEEAAYLYLDLLGHDVRNHLQGMMIGVDMLEFSDDEETIQTATETLREGIRKTARLIDKVKATEDLHKSPLKPRRLDQAIAKVIEQCRARFKEAELEVQIETQEATIAADENLEYLIMHLIENAVQENPNEKKKIWISLSKDVNGLQLSISDNGKGLPDRRKEEIFTSSRRYGGVGLHQVKQIAEKYGGYVQVKDRIPQDYSEGAEFRVYFPHTI